MSKDGKAKVNRAIRYDDGSVKAFGLDGRLMPEYSGIYELVRDNIFDAADKVYTEFFNQSDGSKKVKVKREDW